VGLPIPHELAEAGNWEAACTTRQGELKTEAKPTHSRVPKQLSPKG